MFCVLYQSVTNQETKNHIKYNRKNLMQGIVRWVMGEVRGKEKVGKPEINIIRKSLNH